MKQKLSLVQFNRTMDEKRKSALQSDEMNECNGIGGIPKIDMVIALCEDWCIVEHDAMGDLYYFAGVN